MIVMCLMGGLGNQLFQYALGRSLSMRIGAPLLFDIPGYRNDAQRVYMLDRFHIEAGIADERVMRGYRRRPRLHRRLRRLFSPGALKVVREEGHPFDPSILGLGDGVYLHGYWQSERYFVDRAAAIREELRLASPLTDARRKVEAAIRSINAVSVHVRRGDYVNMAPNALLTPLPLGWYEAALGRIAQSVKDPTFFVFSDDPTWARANLVVAERPMVFVEPQADGRDEQDMHLMSLCRHHVIANSTFSWWGAWLNPAPDKRVIAPRRWFSNASVDARDIVPESWERL